MKLLLVGGYADSLLNFRGPLIDDLLKAGVEVHVAAPGLNDSCMSDALRARGVTPHSLNLQRTGMNPLADLGSLYGLWSLMRRLRPNVFLGYTIKPVIYGSLAAWLAGVGGRYALITGLGYAFQDRPHTAKARLVAGLARRLYRYALSRATKVFFQNPDDEALFRTLNILNPRTPSIVVNGSGVDIQEFDQFEPPQDPIVFLMIARLLVAKGVREYVQAAKQLRAEFPSVQFLLAGWLDEGPDSVEAQELAAWEDEGVVEYLGRLTDVRPALRRCSVYVLPSYREGTPRTVLEAMAVGRAIITTDAPGCRETVTNGHNGYLVPVRSVESLGNAMRCLLDSPNDIQRFGYASRRLAEEKYDVKKVNAVMLREMGVKS
ncbi:glycosyltransferase family 1 protein [Pusillimonas sp. T2]|nr:glycosyltransferase family 4 protein [Pusillimonas sp. T2]OXR50242.1 glycosyltransferase family 1 protein [Pusillimonas sp. T2]